jgi:hypothetical protein
VVGGSYGPAVDTHPQIKPYNLTNTYQPTNILIDRVNFHDFTRSNEAVHTECLQIYGGAHVIVRRSKFNNCDGTGDLTFGQIGIVGINDFLIENNWFGADGDAFYSIQNNLCGANIVFRYNSLAKGIASNNCDSHANGTMLMVANYMPWTYATCLGAGVSVTFKYNVMKGGTCGPTDVNVKSLDFVDAAHFDLHLTARSAGICRGDPNNFPRGDIQGRGRLFRFRPDAGASQAELTVKQRLAIKRCRRQAP